MHRLSTLESALLGAPRRNASVRPRRVTPLQRPSCRMPNRDVPRSILLSGRWLTISMGPRVLLYSSSDLGPMGSHLLLNSRSDHRLGKESVHIGLRPGSLIGGSLGRLLRLLAAMHSKLRVSFACRRRRSDTVLKN